MGVASDKFVDEFVISLDQTQRIKCYIDTNIIYKVINKTLWKYNKPTQPNTIWI